MKYIRGRPSEVSAGVKLGLELVARRPVALKLGSFFETWFSGVGGVIPRSLGRDEYHLALVLALGRRLAATGRVGICQCDVESIGLGRTQALPCRPAEALVAPEEPLLFGLRTNAFLDLPALTAGVLLRLCPGGTPVVECSLEDPRLRPEAISPGRYLVECSALLPGAGTAG